MKDLVSIAPLRESEYLSHSFHKYIRRESDGKGGFRYFYENTVQSFKDRTGLTQRQIWQNAQRRANRYSDKTTHTGSTYQAAKAASNQSQYASQLVSSYDQRRTADEKRADSEYKKYSQTTAGKIENDYNTAKKSISSISKEAGSLYDKGASFLRKIFS